MRQYVRVVLALVLGGLIAVPVQAEHLVALGEADARIADAMDTRAENVATVSTFLTANGADAALASRLTDDQLSDAAGQIQIQQQQGSRPSTGIYLLAGAGVLLLLLLIIGLAAGASD